jgi:branched-chain amino acid transport system ATP-binding protein
MTATPAGTPVLEVRGLTRRFGGVTAVDALSMSVGAGETLGVIGPNGAGKTTLISLISGALPASAGSVHLLGTDITRLGPARRSRLGIGRTYQVPRPFGRMTVMENLLLAARHAGGRQRLHPASHRRCAQILERTGLQSFERTPAGQLPLLRRKRLELARALAARPRLLLLDEIGAGLVKHEIAELTGLIRDLRGEVDAMLVVEHVMDIVTACCERTLVLDFGRVVTAGPTSTVLRDPTVGAVYLGTASAHPGEAARPAQPGDAQPAPGPVAGEAQPAPGLVRDAAARALLEVRDVHVAYGGVRALRGVSLELGPGEVVALLGANGAGKTTLARAVSGAVPVGSGAIRLGGRRIDGLPPERVAASGVTHCLEGRRIFGGLTVRENLMLAADGASRADMAARLDAAYQLFPALAARRNDPGTQLSGGQQQMLAIGRALMARPRLVILDEVSLGLAPLAVDRLYDALRAIRDSGVAMLLVEQNLERGLSLADRAYVLADGRIALSGSPADIRRHPALRSLYVGESGGDVLREPASRVGNGATGINYLSTGRTGGTR